MQSTTNITLDLQRPNVAVTVDAKQNDLMSRVIAAQLKDGSAEWTIPLNASAFIRYLKPDNTGGFYDTMEDNTTPAYTVSGSVITFILCEQMLTVPGNVYVEINFYTPDEKLTSFSFLLRVQASVIADATIVSSAYYNVMTATLAQMAAIAANLPAPSTATPLVDSGSGVVGVAGDFARGDHQHPLNVPTSGTPADLGTAANGTAPTYARSDHVHNMPSASDVGALPDTTTPADIGAMAVGAALHISVASFSSLPQTISDAGITADMRVVECVFGTPSAITSDITWTTAAGSLTLAGTISGSTTADIILIETV